MVVTAGSTLLGAASVLVAAYPSANIVGFAGVRAVSEWYDVESMRQPCIGTIRLLESGLTKRDP